MSTPLTDALRHHLALNRAPFHTPGHKGHMPDVWGAGFDGIAGHRQLV